VEGELMVQGLVLLQRLPLHINQCKLSWSNGDLNQLNGNQGFFKEKCISSINQ
jgi:hypothetical protein